MLLLQFSLSNHASFRDEATLNLVSHTLKSQVPRDSHWLRYVSRVAAIYGPNASGKSALLHGMRFFTSMVRNSATTWAGDPKLPRRPFLLDVESANRPSTFVLDFVVDDVRYEYGRACGTWRARNGRSQGQAGDICHENRRACGGLCHVRHRRA